MGKKEIGLRWMARKVKWLLGRVAIEALRKLVAKKRRIKENRAKGRTRGRRCAHCAHCFYGPFHTNKRQEVTGGREDRGEEKGTRGRANLMRTSLQSSVHVVCGEVVALRVTHKGDGVKHERAEAVGERLREHLRHAVLRPYAHAQRLADDRHALRRDCCHLLRE